jgi:glycerol-3-phosphate acyltransferase PlsY
VAAIAASYLIGGVPVGVLIGKSRGVDIRQQGSGNIGATNVLRVLGVKWGLLAFALDVLKGAAPVLGGSALGLHGWGLYGCGIAAVVGHCYSPYLRFAGGKAVATGLGVLLAFNWVAGLICFGLWALITAATRYVSLASMIAYAAAPLLAWLLGDDPPLIGALCFLTVVSVYRHRENIRRLRAGTESRIGQRGRPPDGDPDPSTAEVPRGGSDT